MTRASLENIFRMASCGNEFSLINHCDQLKKKDTAWSKLKEMISVAGLPKFELCLTLKNETSGPSNTEIMFMFYFNLTLLVDNVGKLLNCGHF